MTNIRIVALAAFSSMALPAPVVAQPQQTNDFLSTAPNLIPLEYTLPTDSMTTVVSCNVAINPETNLLDLTGDYGRMISTPATHRITIFEHSVANSTLKFQDIRSDQMLASFVDNKGNITGQDCSSGECKEAPPIVSLSYAWKVDAQVVSACGSYIKSDPEFKGYSFGNILASAVTPAAPAP